jgi:hypothetical protein
VGRGGSVLLAVLGCAAVAALAPLRAEAAARPVPTLTPMATDALWQELVRRPRVHPLRAGGACAPLRAVFYASTDWLRLATKLAATPSPCAEYFVSVPPVAADKTRLRADQARRIRALGRSFHALAEINVTGWTTWVATTGNDWHAAGVEARRRMAAAGFDVAAGDTWALNELTSAVRQGVGNARANMRAFVSGLYDGAAPAARGVVFITGLSQSSGELSVYQARLQDWYEDEAFWIDMSRFVSDWSQELYGDVRSYAAPGAPPSARRDSLNEYLQHELALAAAAPPSVSAARAFLPAAYNPLANAAWQYDTAYGFTNVPLDLMQDYVSAQTYALRSAKNSRFGFAWAPRNAAAIPAGDFAAQTDALLVRLAAAISDSAASPEAACAGGWCTRSLAGAAFRTGWRAFATWSPSALAFTTPQPVVVAGTASPLAIELRTFTGVPYTAGIPVAVTLTSTSPTGVFATTPTGPWSPTLTVSIASGASTASFYFTDTTPGAPTIAANAAGKTGAVLTAIVTAPPGGTPPETILSAAPTGLVRSRSASFTFSSSVAGVSFQCSLDGGAFAPCTSPASYTGLTDGAHVFDVRAVDASGNVDPTPGHAAWSIDATAPSAVIAAGPRERTSAARATFWFSAERGARLDCSLDGGAFARCSSPARYSGLRAGRHTFRVRATDAAGNADPSPTRWTWTIDRTPPRTTITRGPKSGTTSRTATLYFRSSEPGSTFRCSLDGRAYAVCTSPLRRSRLPRTTHTFRVRAVDAAGNVDRTPATYRWRIR